MINPVIFLWGGASFLIALLVHILVWRIFQPPRQMMWLVIIFIIFPGLLFITLFAVSHLGTEPTGRFLASPFNLFLLIIWHTALSSAYIMTYPPIQTGCPSLKIILAIHSFMPEGLTAEKINEFFSQDTLFTDRFNDLIEDGLISWEYDTWGITATGKLLSKFFSTYRRFLKLPTGEG